MIDIQSQPNQIQYKFPPQTYSANTNTDENIKIYKQNQLQNSDYYFVQENNINTGSYNPINPSPYFIENSPQNEYKPQYHPMNNNMNSINDENDNENNNHIYNQENDEYESDNNNINNEKNKKNIKNEEKQKEEEIDDPDNELFDDKEKIVKKEKNNEEDELSSMSDKSNESNDEKNFNNHLLAQYEKVRRVKDKWKLNLKGCIVQKDQMEYVCGKLHGELNRDW